MQRGYPFANQHRLTLGLVVAGIVCLLGAPHLAVTRIDHCGMRITLHMMETYWTVIFAVAAIAGAVTFFCKRFNLLAFVGMASAGYAVFLLAQIRLWYSYQEVPDNLDLMAKVFGHVMDVG